MFCGKLASPEDLPVASSQQLQENPSLRSEEQTFYAEFVSERALARILDRRRVGATPVTLRRLQLLRGRGKGPAFIRLGGAIFYRRARVKEWLATLEAELWLDHRRGE